MLFLCPKKTTVRNTSFQQSIFNIVHCTTVSTRTLQHKRIALHLHPSWNHTVEVSTQYEQVSTPFQPLFWKLECQSPSQHLTVRPADRTTIYLSSIVIQSVPRKQASKQARKKASPHFFYYSTPRALIVLLNKL